MELKFRADYINEAEHFKVGSVENIPGYAMIVEDTECKYFGKRGEDEPVRCVVFGITDAEYAWKDTDEQKLIGLARLLGSAAPRDRVIAQLGKVERQSSADTIDNGAYTAFRRIKQFGYSTADSSLKWIANSVLKSDKVETELIEGSSIETICRMVIMHEELMRSGEKLSLPQEKLRALAAGLGKRIREAEEIFMITAKNGGIFVNNGLTFVFSKIEYAGGFANALNAQQAEVSVTKITGQGIAGVFDALKKAGVQTIVVNAGHAEVRTDCETIFPTQLLDDTDEYDELSLSELIPYYNAAKRVSGDENAQETVRIFYERLFDADALYMMYNRSLGDAYPTVDANGFAWFFTEEELAKEIKEKNKNIDLEYKKLDGARFRKMMEGEFYRLGIRRIRFNCGRNFADVERDEAVNCADGVKEHRLTNSHMMFELIRFMQARGANTKETAQMTMQHMNEAFHDFTNTVFIAPMYYEGERGKNVCDKTLHFSARASELMKQKSVNFYNEGEITGFAENAQGRKMFYETLTKHEQGKPDTLWFPLFSDYKECFKMFDRHKYRACVVTFDDVVEQMNDSSKRFFGAILNCKSIGLNVPKNDIENLHRVNEKNNAINAAARLRPEFDTSEYGFTAVVLDANSAKERGTAVLSEALSGTVSVGDEMKLVDKDGAVLREGCRVSAIDILSRNGQKVGNKVGIVFAELKPEDFKTGQFMVCAKKEEKPAYEAQEPVQAQQPDTEKPEVQSKPDGGAREFVNREAVLRAIDEQKRIIEENKRGLFGEKARRRQEAQKELAHLEEELKKY